MTLHIAVANGERCKCLKARCVYNLQRLHKSILLLLAKLSSLSVWRRNCILVKSDRLERWCAHTCTYTQYRHTQQHDCWKRAEHWISFHKHSTWNCLTFTCKHVLLTCSWYGYNVNDRDTPLNYTHTHAHTIHTRTTLTLTLTIWTCLLLRGVCIGTHCTWDSGTWRFRACNPFFKVWPIGTTFFKKIFLPFLQNLFSFVMFLFSVSQPEESFFVSHSKCVYGLLDSALYWSQEFQWVCVCKCT